MKNVAGARGVFARIASDLGGGRTSVWRVVPRAWAQGGLHQPVRPSIRTRPPRASPTQPAARPAGAAGQLVPARRRRLFNDL